jgi:hypothetical protein
MSHASEIFSVEFAKLVAHPSPDLVAITYEIAQNHMTDLAPTHGHFTPETQDALSAEAARRWSQTVAGRTLDASALRQAWGELARDFHSNNYWGHETVAKKVKRQKKPNIALSMMITTFVSFVGTKCLVLFFGSREINDPSAGNQIALIIAVMFSFGTLFYFAWKHTKLMKEEDPKQE